MIITDHKALPTALLSRLDENPFAKEHQKIASDISSLNADYSYYLDEITSYSKKIEQYKANCAYMLTKRKTQERNLTAVAKAMSEYKSDVDLSILDRIQEIVNQTGNRFVAVNFVDGQTSTPKVYVKYVRPPKLIERLPQQPFLITLAYTTRDGILTFTSAKCSHKFSSSQSGYCHPHLSSGDGNVCLGNFLDILNEHKVGVGLLNVQDHIILLDNLLCTYNPDSPYRGLDSLIRELANGFYTQDHSTTIDLGASIVADNIKSAIETKLFDPKYAMGVAHFIGKDLYDQWVKMLENANISMREIAEEKIIQFRNDIGNADDSYTENYDHAVMLYDRLKRDFPEVKFSKVEDFAYEEYDDSEESSFYELSSDSWDELFENWACELEENLDSITSNLVIQLPKLELLSFNIGV